MKVPFKAKFTMCTALAGILGMVLPCASPANAQAQTKQRTAVLRDAKAPPAPMPDVNILSELRHHAMAVPAPAVAATTLDYPYGITVDASSNVYVTNLFGGVNIYSHALKKTGEITEGLNFPAAVAVSFSGNIYVANNGSGNVTVYNPSLAQIGTISDPTLASPTSMFIDADDTAWVLDSEGTLHAYLNDGNTLPSTHTGGNVVGPWGPNVTVWGVADSNGGYDETFENRAQAVNAGPYLYNDFVDGSPYAAGEAQDQYANQYVSDLLHAQIQIWNPQGLYEIGTINTPAPPYGIAVDPLLNRLYVVLTTLNEVYVYSTKAPYKQLAIIK